MKHFRPVNFLWIGLLIQILLLNSCGPEKEKPLSETEIPIFQAILKENDNVVEALLRSENLVPDTSKLLSLIDSFAAINGNGQKKALEMKEIIQKIDKSNLQTSFENLSKFSEILAATMKTNQLSGGHNQFYCPMVRKTWVLSGKKIRNPYAPEMRDCGELIP
ncbi:hypothetical protein CH373_13225 [Leptospira perolatii]|uniref:DUF3347 domain-containing protein n=2 Tax=Leptospira perolatii TaxID=2023191 RepID=A0A2M9ZL02_9LEPT|nr:DUF3347 domain-containing protein [Leptospira perolatii]PJZ70011.1 hypothetical protein CH360_08460 [Leptospira perolatii]PJZ72738.1 hypothetical protein CH373_13225 [Leptospira perolatii]